MQKWLTLLRPSPWLARRLVVVVALVAVGIAAHWWGRRTARAEVEAYFETLPGFDIAKIAAGKKYDTSGRVVAYIYGDRPIYRDELGEYLIDRFGAERIDFLVNRRVVEEECRSKGIEIRDVDVENQLREDIRVFGGGNMTAEQFEKQVLVKFKKTLFEWKEDVIKPKLALQRLVEPTITVSPEDVQREFEARYGPKVQVRMIVLQKDDQHAQKVWEHARQNEDGFLEEARKQFIPDLASRSGDIPPIHKHTEPPEIAKHAFSLNAGEVSALVKMPDGSQVIMRCEKHLEPNKSARLEDERLKLMDDIKARKLTTGIPLAFQKMRDRAHPRIILTGGSHANVANTSGGTKTLASLPPPQ
jgi:hypothetical protein